MTKDDLRERIAEDMKRFFLMFDNWRANEGKVSDFQLARAYTTYIEPIKFDILESIRGDADRAERKRLADLIEARIVAWQAIDAEEDPERLKKMMKVIVAPTIAELAHAQSDAVILELQYVLKALEAVGEENQK